MNDDERRKLEEAVRAAELKAAALHNLGWEVGAGATIWARAVQDELARHEEARAHLADGTADLEIWERINVTALMVVVAIQQVLTYARRVHKLTGDARLRDARDRVVASVCRDADDLRDLIAHLDDYAVGSGQRQTGQRLPPINDTNLATFMSWSNGGGTIIELSGQTMNLREAAEAVTELAKVVEDVRARYLQRAEQEGNAAFRQLHGI